MVQNVENYIEFIKEKHKGQKRIQGTEYYLHPIQVANILKEKGFDKKYQIVALFHDLLEDTNTTYEQILKISNKDIADAVKLLTKEPNYIMEQYVKKIKENEIAKMVKLADRLHNLSEAHFASRKFIDKYINETKEWYIDLANETVFEEDINRELERLINLNNSEK
ncbi:MAG TPA: hypothetical protein DCZ30_07285 [Clostridiales bacterium]|nr:hypothetical protein [Clostridiales bacterium]